MTLVSAALGLLVGLTLGILGGGGSILCVPIFVYVLDLPPREAVAGSLAVVGATAAVGAFRHYRHDRVRVKTALLFGAVAMGAAYVGARVGTQMSGPGQLTLFALTMLVASVFMAREPADGDAAVPRPVGVVGAAAVGVGLLTGMVGVGGGFLIVPALVLLLGMPMKEAVGTSLMVIVLNAASALLGYLGDVSLPWGLLASFTGFTVAGILVGVRLVARIPQPALRRGFSVFLVAMAAFILWENREIFHAAPARSAAAAAPPSTASNRTLLAPPVPRRRPGAGPPRANGDPDRSREIMADAPDGGIQEKDVTQGSEDETEPSSERVREIVDEMREMGWQGSPLVVHGDQVLGGAERYEAARFLGQEDRAPRVSLDEVFAEAGMDMPQIASPEGGTTPGQEFFEDYLRDLPRHVRDKYEI